jgi:hypothetical protein
MIMLVIVTIIIYLWNCKFLQQERWLCEFRPERFVYPQLIRSQDRIEQRIFHMHCNVAA